MKTLKDILFDYTGMLPKNHPSIEKAMKKYAEECAKASLDEAIEQLINEYPKLESMETKIKESITNPENIILL